MLDILIHMYLLCQEKKRIIFPWLSIFHFRDTDCRSIRCSSPSTFQYYQQVDVNMTTDTGKYGV